MQNPCYVQAAKAKVGPQLYNEAWLLDPNQGVEKIAIMILYVGRLNPLEVQIIHFVT